MSWAAKKAKAALQAGQHFEKYTVQPKGIWGRINNLLAVDPKRSSGVPLNPQFRNPPPGTNDPLDYDDPVTLPAADIAENPYWKRDVRRRYPQLSTVTQGDVVGLLSVGSKSAPKDDVLQLGDAGKQQLVAVAQEGKQLGIAGYLAKEGEKMVGKSVLSKDGLPPRPPTTVGQKVARLIPESEQTYGAEYPCRTWN